MLGGLIVDFGGVLTDPGDGDGTERPLLTAVARARAHGVRTGLLSNADGAVPLSIADGAAPLSMADGSPADPPLPGGSQAEKPFSDGSPADLSPLFDAVVFSGEVGFGKPDLRIYLLTADRLGLVPEQCVFVDDLASNVLGAVRAGMVGVHHTDVDSTLTELSALFGFEFQQR